MNVNPNDEKPDDRGNPNVHQSFNYKKKTSII
jgi:hypothetical protein